MAGSVDVAIVGGGLVGLSTAVALAERWPDRRIALLEKEPRFARHQSGRNSGVIHSGIYYRPGSLKARFCRNGRTRLLEFCDRHGIDYEICGKLLVAAEPREVPMLDALEERGRANGLEVVRLAPEEVRELEPHVRCVSALAVPEAGVVDFGGVAQKLAEIAAAIGVELWLECPIESIRGTSRGHVLSTGRGSLYTRLLVNCAGLHSDRVARMAGLRPPVRIVPFRGEYYDFRPESGGIVKGLVYPVPDPALPFLGVHVTRTIHGGLHAGPNAVLALQREGYRRRDVRLRDTADVLMYPGFWRLARAHYRAGMQEVLRSASKSLFVHSLRRLVPDVAADDLVPAAAGVRAQALAPDGKLVDDFLVLDGPRSVHVCNAPSPGATSSIALGAMIAERILGGSSSGTAAPVAAVAG